MVRKEPMREKRLQEPIQTPRGAVQLQRETQGNRSRGALSIYRGAKDWAVTSGAFRSMREKMFAPTVHLPTLGSCTLEE